MHTTHLPTWLLPIAGAALDHMVLPEWFPAHSLPGLKSLPLYCISVAPSPACHCCHCPVWARLVGTPDFIVGPTTIMTDVSSAPSVAPGTWRAFRWVLSGRLNPLPSLCLRNEQERGGSYLRGMGKIP